MEAAERESLNGSFKNHRRKPADVRVLARGWDPLARSLS